MKRNNPATSYWPGYVDVLVNVVLNVLFLVGLMAACLVTLNVEAIGHLKAVHQAEQLQQIQEENLLLAALGTMPAASPEAPKSIVAEPLAPSPTAEPVRPLLAAPTAPAPAPLPTPALAPAPTPAAPAVLPVGKPFQLLPAAQELAFVQSRVNAKDRSWKVLEFQPLQYQLTSAQVRALQTSVDAESSMRWLVLASVPAKEDRLAREAFWRLTSVREKLIAVGVKPESIAMRTVVQDGINFSNGRRVFIEAQPAAPALSN